MDSSSGRRIRIGASTKLAADVLGRALQFVLVYAAQRTLGPEMYGQFAYALAVGYVLMPATDLGVQLTLTQQISRDPARAGAWAGSALLMKVALTGVATGVLAWVSRGRPPELRLATVGLGAAMMLGSFVEFFGYAFRGLHRVERDAALSLFNRALTAAIGLGFLAAGLRIAGLTLAYLIGAAIAALVGLVWMGRTIRLRASMQLCGDLIRPALPLGVGIVLSLAYTRTGLLLLDTFDGPAAVGMYGVAQKLTEPLAIVPAALLAAVFPAFVGARVSAPERAAVLHVRSVWLLAGIGAVIAAGGVVGGPLLIALLYGDQYAGAVVPFQLLAVGVLLTFVNYALTHFVIAHDLQRRYLLFTATVFAVNLGLCLWLIPRFGPAGVALAAVASEALLLALCWRALRTATQFDEQLAVGVVASRT